MVTGETTHELSATGSAENVELEPGQGLMPGGRISTALEAGSGAAASTPFTSRELAHLDEALTLSSRETGLDFSVYLGDLGEDTRERAEELHGSTADPADAVVIAVSPGQRKVEIVTGAESGKRLADRSCKLAVMSMVASFREGDLVGGLVSGLRLLTEQAGTAPH